MIGFVDVSNMTSQQIKRLGQMDDDYEAPRSTRQAKPAPVSYSTDNVWGAACAAQRINGSYVKETQYRYDEALNTSVVAKYRNRELMQYILANPAQLTVEDIAQGQECRKFLQQDLTFRALKGKLTDFDQNVAKTLAVADEFNSAKHRLELALVACLPASQQRAIARQETASRVRQTTGEYVGAVDSKVELNVEVVSATYSQTYGIFWVTAITQDNQAVFFSYKSKLETGTSIQIKGTVKAHRDGKTQLNRVKVV